LNQNWTIKDNQTDMVLGIYNPTITNPTFGLFNPPVLPCQSRDITFKLCPENLPLCQYRVFDVGVNFLFADGDPACPTIQKQLSFGWVSSVAPIDLNHYINLNQNEGVLSIDFSTSNDKFSSESMTLIISDVFGKVLMNVDLSQNHNNINIEKLVNGKYFGSVNQNNEPLGIFNFIIMK
jgi:hypothetical protein